MISSRLCFYVHIYHEKTANLRACLIDRRRSGDFNRIRLILLKSLSHECFAKEGGIVHFRYFDQ